MSAEQGAPGEPRATRPTRATESAVRGVSLADGDVRTPLLLWARASRIPLVGAWLARQGAARLARRADRSIDAARLLARQPPTALPPAQESLRRAVLSRLSDPAAIEAVVEVWSQRRDPVLDDLVRRHRWLAHQDPRAAVLSRLATGKPEGLSGCDASLVPHLVDAARDPDLGIRAAALEILARLEDPEAREQLCEIAQRDDRPVARRVVVEAGFQPREPARRAVFYLLTEQWARYDELDFDRRLLRLGYNLAERETRATVVARIRRAGRVDLTPALRGHSALDARSVSLPEAELKLTILRERGEWDALFRALFELPVTVSARAVRTLRQAGWRPESERDRACFSDLVQLAHDPLWSSSSLRRAAGLPLTEHFRTVVPGGVRGLAFSPTEPLLAVAGGDRRVRVWDHLRRDLVRELDPHAGGVGRLGFLSDGALVFADSNDPHRPERVVFRSHGGDAHELLRTRGAVTAVEAAAGGRLLLTIVHDSEARIELREGATGELVTQRRTALVIPGGGRSTARASQDGHRIATLAPGGRLDVHRLPDLERITLPATVVRGLVEQLEFAPDGASVLAGLHSGELLEFRWDGDRFAADPRPLARHAGAIRGLAALRQGSAVVAADDTFLRAVSWLDKEDLGRIPHELGTVRDLAVSPDESWLALATDASVSVWDLRLLGILLLSGSLARAVPQHLAVLELTLSDRPLGRGERLIVEYVRAVLRHHFRNAIELDAEPRRDFGATDIELDLDG